jgi:hypothetical protein
LFYYNKFSIKIQYSINQIFSVIIEIQLNRHHNSSFNHKNDEYKLGVAPNNSQQPKAPPTVNNYNCYTFYNEQSNNYQGPSSRPGQALNQYYHWQGSDASGKSPNCESQASMVSSSSANQNSLMQQHNRLLNITSALNQQQQQQFQQPPQQISGQIKSSLVKLSSKKSRKSSNLHALFSPTSSMQSYGTRTFFSLFTLSII